MCLKLLDDKHEGNVSLIVVTGGFGARLFFNTSIIKGHQVGDSFWLYHRLLYAREVNSSIATDDATQGKKSRERHKLTSDKVHECSFKKQSQTNKHVLPAFARSYTVCQVT